MEEKLAHFYELFEKRNSVREFDARPVEDDKLGRLLESLRRAQSAANRQPWQFVVVRDENREDVNTLLYKEGFKDAPLLIAACAEPSQAWTRKADQVNYSWVDVTIAVTEMIAVATAEGLGTCWIAAIDPARVKDVLGIPDGIDVVALIAVGYPKEEMVRQEKKRKPLEEIIRYGKW